MSLDASSAIAAPYVRARPSGGRLPVAFGLLIGAGISGAMWVGLVAGLKVLFS